MKEKKQKMSRKERERLMIAQMEAAMWEQKHPDETPAPKQAETPAADKPQAEKSAKQLQKAPVQKVKKAEQKAREMHCPRCKSVMENGKCPTCGHYVYVPMSKEQRNKIRLIVGGICVVGFVILFFIMQFKK